MSSRSLALKQPANPSIERTLPACGIQSPLMSNVRAVSRRVMQTLLRSRSVTSGGTARGSAAYALGLVVRCALGGLCEMAPPASLGSTRRFGSSILRAAASAQLRRWCSLALPLAAPVRRLGSGAGFARAAAVGSVSLRADSTLAQAFAIKVSSAAIRVALTWRSSGHPTAVHVCLLVTGWRAVGCRLPQR